MWLCFKQNKTESKVVKDEKKNVYIQIKSQLRNHEITYGNCKECQHQTILSTSRHQNRLGYQILYGNQSKFVCYIMRTMQKLLSILYYKRRRKNLLTSGIAFARFPKMTPITLVFLLILSLDFMKFIASQMFENSTGTPD